MYIINYRNFDENDYYTGVAISKVHPKIEYETDDMGKYGVLIPDRNFDGKIDNEDKIREYIRYYYTSILSKLNPEKVYKDLEYDRLVTFDDGEFSHGYIVAAWFELFLGVQVKCVN